MNASTQSEILAVLDKMSIIDAHTHLVGGHLGAKGLHDIFLYHMSVSDLHAAGCPSGSRLTPYPSWPSRQEAHRRITEALPYLPHVANTSIQWGVRTILADLYDWHEPIDADNWQTLDDRIRQRSDDRAWHREIMARARIVGGCTELARRGDGCDDDILDYALEWLFFTRFQRGEFDTALYELERAWGNTPQSPMPIGGERPPVERTIRNLDDVHEALAHIISVIPFDRIVGIATHLSTDVDLTAVSREQMAQAIRRRGEAGPRERDIYASYVNEAFLTALERHADQFVYQFSYAAEPMPFETASRISSRSLRQLADMISRHKSLRFQCFLGSAHANQALCTMCRQLPNLSLSAYWWHNFFPSVIRQIMQERLDMLPVNRQIGFFSDAYCIEWAYAKAVLIRRILADVLAEKVCQGQYTRQQAVDVARATLFDAPLSLLGLQPRHVG
jgi:hypothetical protein